MKAKDRELYLLLTDIPLPSPPGQRWQLRTWNVGLCHFCKLAEWSGSSCGDDSELDCNSFHDDIVEQCYEVWAGEADCWAFKPEYRREDCVDMVGILLQGQWPDLSSLTEKEDRKK